MEIYVGTTDATTSIVAPVEPTGGTIDIKAVNNLGDILYDFPTVVPTDDGYSVSLPWSLTRNEGEFFIDWAFEYEEDSETKTVEIRQKVNVVTPILSLVEIASITGLTDNADISDLERRVRFSIQTYTATTFGRFIGTIPVIGTGDSKLHLPLPILSIESPLGLSIFGSGWEIGTSAKGYDGGIKTAPPDEVLNQFYSSSGPIYAPLYSRKLLFRDDVTYNVKGLWGYYDVPADVQQAARLLIADYACDESLWRDRYISAIKSGDWRIDFNAAAYTGTGNVSADHILSQHRRSGMVAI